MTNSIFGAASDKLELTRSTAVRSLFSASVFAVLSLSIGCTGIEGGSVGASEEEAVSAAPTLAMQVAGGWRQGGTSSLLGCPPSDPNCIEIGGSGEEGVMPPDVLFGADIYMTTWRTTHLGVPTIMGARVTPDGKILDPAGFVISAGLERGAAYRSVATSSSSPRLAFDGTNFLVVWQDERNGTSDIYGSRVSPEGAVLDPAGIPISTNAAGQTSPAVASNGTDFLVVWSDGRSSSSLDLYGARVGTDGSVRDPDGLALLTDPDEQDAPALAFGGTDYLVAFENTDADGATAVSGILVAPDGTAGMAVRLDDSSSLQTSPAVASDGRNFLVAFESYGSSGTDIRGAVLDSAGAVLSRMTLSDGKRDQTRPDIDFDGTDYLVVWASELGDGTADILGTRVNPDGKVLLDAPLAIAVGADPATAPAAAFDGSRHLVTWTALEEGVTAIYGAFVTP